MEPRSLTPHIQGKSRQQLSTTKAYTHLTNFASKMKANDNTFTRSSKRNEAQPSKVVKITNTKRAVF